MRSKSFYDQAFQICGIGILRYELSFIPGYAEVAIRQVMRRHGMDEMKRLLYSVRMFIRYIANR